MSQGRFGTFRYLTSEPTPRVLPIRLQPESVVAPNAEAAGTISPGSQRVKAPGSSRRSYGIHSRYITLTRNVGTEAGPYTGGSVSVKIPILDPASVISFPIGAAATYGGYSDWEVASYTPEFIR